MEFDRSVDASNLRGVLLDFPKQFQKAWELCRDIRVQGSYESVCVAGMGGSSMPGALLETYLGDRLTFPLYLGQGYALPPQVNERTLVFCISYSGTTEESLAQFAEARSRGLSVVCIASGGTLIEKAKAESVPYVQVPSGLQPRFATGYQMTPMLAILSKLGMIPEVEKEVIALSRVLDPVSLEERGKEIATSIIGKTPVFYASDRYAHIVRIMKIKFNENAKTPAFWNVFPELNHNEMNGWMHPQGKFGVIILRDGADDERVRRRMSITADLIVQQGVDCRIVEIEDKESRLATMLTVLLLGDWASYYTALAYRQDPTPVEMVEHLKAELKNH